MCNAAGVVGNRVCDDQNGWDFLVEFPPVASDQPADLGPPGQSCFVQIKSSRSRRKSCNFKLSNAIRFAQHALPCFTVLLVFDGDAVEPSEIYVQHFWSDQIRAALEAARRAHLDGIAALHQVVFPVRFSDYERCPRDEVISRIEAAITAVGPRYPAAKVQLAQTVGYEDGWGAGSFTLAEGVDPETLVDLMLGRVEDVPISAFELRDARFGLKGPAVTPNSPGRLSVDPTPLESCLVTVSPMQGGEELSLKGDVYVPGIPDLPEHLRKIRIQAGVLEVTLKPSGGKPDSGDVRPRCRTRDGSHRPDRYSLVVDGSGQP